MDKNYKKLDFDQLWVSHFSNISPLDCMPANLRDKLKEFAWKVYWEGCLSESENTSTVE